MKLIMPLGFRVSGAVVIALLLVLPSQAAARQAAGGSKEPNGQARAVDSDAVPDIPVLVDLPESKPGQAAGSTARPARPHTPGKERSISIRLRQGADPKMWALGAAPDGVENHILKGGIVIVSKSLKYGTIRIEDEEAEISHGPRPKVDEPADGESFRDDIDTPMTIRFKGNVVAQQRHSEIEGGREQWTIRAPEVEFDCVADRLLATDAKMEISEAGLLAPIKITAPRIEAFHPVERRPDGSLAPSQDREIRLDPAEKTIHD